MSDTLQSRSGQLQHRNLRPGAEADRGAGGSNAAVDVQLPATNPENLADNQHHKESEEGQEIERTHFTPTGGEPEGAKGNQRESDHALVSSEEADHRCHLRAGKLNHFPPEIAGS